MWKYIVLAVITAASMVFIGANAGGGSISDWIIGSIAGVVIFLSTASGLYIEDKHVKTEHVHAEDRKIRELARDVAKPLEELIADAEKKAVEEFEYDYGLKPEPARPEPRLPNPFREPEWKI